MESKTKENLPKVKARELMGKYYNAIKLYLPLKDACLIHVDEMIKSWSAYSGMHDQDFFDSEVAFWQQVKQELTNLE